MAINRSNPKEISRVLIESGFVSLESFELIDPGGYAMGYDSISEEITIPVGSGLVPPVDSIGDLASENTVIIGVSYEVIQAPGGGATIISIGRTNGGNLNEFIDIAANAPCANLGDSGSSHQFTDGSFDPGGELRIAPGGDDTFRLTTDADVTISDMIVNVTVFFRIM